MPFRNASRDPAAAEVWASRSLRTQSRGKGAITGWTRSSILSPSTAEGWRDGEGLRLTCRPCQAVACGRQTPVRSPNGSHVDQDDN